MVSRREQIQRSLRNLAASHATHMRLLEQTLSLLSDELAVTSTETTQLRRRPKNDSTDRNRVEICPDLLSIRFDSKICFLGNSIPFKFLSRLARHPNTFVTYHELLADVWQGIRSDSAVRSIAKTVRQKLRNAGMSHLADAIVGTVPGHYILKLTP